MDDRLTAQTCHQAVKEMVEGPDEDKAMVQAADNEFVLHPTPVWRDRADFVINAELEAQDQPQRFEQLWARRVRDDEFEICCIPFFLFDLALGDVVATKSHAQRRYLLDRVVRPSGRYVFRVWFGESYHPRDEIAEMLKEMGPSSNGRRRICSPSMLRMRHVLNVSPTTWRTVSDSSI